MTQCVGRFACHVLSAGRSCTMRGIYDNIVSQGHNFVAEGIVQVCREVFLCERFVLSKIGTAHIADKKRIAGEQGYVFAVLIAEQVTSRLHVVSGRMEGQERHFSYADDLTVGGDVCLKGGPGGATVDDA